MIILAHRAQDIGIDSYSPLPSRFGIEIDVRIRGGDLMMSHDPCERTLERELGNWLAEDFQTAGSTLSLSEEREGPVKRTSRPIYAINVKEDGVEEGLVKVIGELEKSYPEDDEPGANPPFYLSRHLFVFDASFPTMRRLKSLNVPVAERISEEEPYRGHSHIIWLDRWDWEDGEGPLMGSRQTATGKACYVPLSGPNGRPTEVYAVSPELHRPHCPSGYRQFWWRRFQEMGCAGICTDYWMECEEFLK